VKLKPEGRFMIIEGLIMSLDEPDKESMRFGRKRRRKGWLPIEATDLEGFLLKRFLLKLN